MPHTEPFEPGQFFSSLSGFDSLFEKGQLLWEAISFVPSFLAALPLDDMGNYIDPTATCHPSAKIINSYVGSNAQIYEFVTLRDSLVGSSTVVGHCSEIARSIIMSNCMIPRFNYIGSSIIGSSVEFGGVCSLATERFDNKSVLIRYKDETIDTKLLKCGSIIGDGSMLGFAVHCNPGTVIGRKCIIMHRVELRGVIPEESVVSVKQNLLITRRRQLHRLGLPNLRARKHMEEI